MCTKFSKVLIIVVASHPDDGDYWRDGAHHRTVLARKS